MGISSQTMKRRASKAALQAQARELLDLRGNMLIKDWVLLVATPYRTYRRYEDGSRVAPGSVMKLARQVRREKKRRA